MLKWFIYPVTPRDLIGLILADIIYGFDQAPCMHNYKQSLWEQELSHMMQAVKMVTILKNYQSQSGAEWGFEDSFAARV